MSRIGIDLDGVCYDFGSSVREYLVRENIRTHQDCPDPLRWEFYEDWGINLREFLDICHAGVDAGIIFTHGDPFPGTREAFERIKDAGHTIHIVTDRSFGKAGASVAATGAWLHRHDLPFDSLTFSADKTVVKLDAMVDDKLTNFRDLDHAGVPTWLYDRPWNHTPTEWLPRVATLNDYAEAVA
ncbi:hypothetical protein ACI3EY_16530 [Ornithinimicrobium sp. LYQ92]|uniref:5' nucleotidase, NT5C type n=1 Tax=Serinicoccus sp. LYQ92 TaxID=3378798 RepID=UPI00385385D9